mgnify:CR=1 FL=1
MTKGNAVTKSQAKIYKSLGIDPVELSKLAQEDAQKALNLLFTKINSKSKEMIFEQNVKIKSTTAYL